VKPDMKPTAVWTASHKISSFEVDPTRKATLQTLCRIMQEAAWNHANSLGLGYFQMVARDLIWVLSRLKIRVFDFPRWGDNIQVSTWPSGIHRLFALRDFQIQDEAGAIVAEATSTWLILNEKSRRPMRIELLFQEMNIPTRGSEPDYRESLKRLPSAREDRMRTLSPVRFSDLDWYNHVNHVKYMDWILDSYALEFHTKFQVTSFEIDFLSETHYGDEISIRTQELEENPPAFLHSLLRKADEEEICVACVHWRERIQGNRKDAGEQK
jgi:medium-chain acyl-[acyl-carrier-protein] hydrolase